MVDEIGTEDEIFEEIRGLIGMLPCNNEEDVSYDECTDDLNRACTSIQNGVGDPAVSLAQISDNGIFFETRRHFAKDMVTGFVKLQRSDSRCGGQSVGAV